MRAKVLTAAGIVHLAIATLLSLTFLVSLPVPAAGSGLGITPTPTFTPTPTPTDTPTATSTPAATSVPVPTAPPDSKPDLTVTKRASSAQVLPGGRVTFIIQVCNVSEAAIDDVVAGDALPPELEVVSASASQGSVTVEGNWVLAELGSLAPGACAEITIVARVRADVPPGTQIVNTAVADEESSDEVSVTVVGFLPESGRLVPLAVVVGLLVLVGASLLATGLSQRSRNGLG